MKAWLDKTIKGLVVAAFMAVPVGLALYEPAPSPTFFQSANLEGQDEAVVGELVRLKATGEAVEWRILPDVNDYQVFGENNQSMVVSFRVPGDYTVVAAILTPELKLEIETLLITVEGKHTPVKPDVKPVPDIPVTIDDKVASKVSNWANEVGIPAPLAEDLAKQFTIVSEEVVRGEIVTVQGILTRTASLTGQLELKPYSQLLDNLQKLLTEEANAGRLVTQLDHANLWKSIANGLNAYASLITVDRAIAIRAR